MVTIDPESKNLRRLYPEVDAGGFSHVDGTVEFYARIVALIDATQTVLDLGAGRGRHHESRAAALLKGPLSVKNKCAELIGADLDPVVLENKQVHRSVVLTPDAPLPFQDASFDLVYADWVLEHVSDPEKFATEIWRIVRPGGWFCARTPNRAGLTGSISRWVSTDLKKRFVSSLKGARTDDDVFPTYYRCNSLSDVQRIFPSNAWKNCSYLSNSEPPYVLRSYLASLMVLLMWRMMPTTFATNLLIFVQRR